MTDALIHALTRAIDEPVHTVLHIGAGPAPLQAYGELAAEHLILVEGDPDTFADLAAELQLSARTGVQAMRRVVLPQGGAVLWHRYNVRRLNAPQTMAALRATYPRLVELSLLPQEGVALAQLANEVLPATAEEEVVRAHALVLDVPGQEAALLAALPPELLRRFRYVAIRGAGQSTGEGWALMSGTVERLRSAYFTLAHQTAETDDPLWPVAVMRCDADALARAQLLDRCQALEEALALARAKQSESEKVVQSLALDRDAQAELVVARQAQIDALIQAKAAAEMQAAERATQLQGVALQHDDQTKLLAERQALIDSLIQARVAAEKQATELATQLQQVAQQCEHRIKQGTERQAQIDSLTQAQGVAERQAAERATQLQQMTQQRDEQANLAAERQTQIDTLTQAMEAAEKRMAESTTRLASITSERQGLLKQLAERGEEVTRLNGRVRSLEGELMSLQRRADLLYQELGRAEGQLEMIKDLLLQEPML